MTSWEELWSAIPESRLSPAEHAEGRALLRRHMADVRPAASVRPTGHMAHDTPFTDVPNAHLTAAEHTDGRGALRRFIAAHPQGDRRGWWRWVLTPSLAAFFLLATAGGVAYGAEGSMPGDFLHPVKVAVNERVLSQFYRGEEGRTLWAMKVLQRRANEADALAAADVTDDAAWATLERLATDADERAERRLHDVTPEIAAVMRRDIASRLPHPDDADPSRRMRVLRTLSHSAQDTAVAATAAATAATFSLPVVPESAHLPVVPAGKSPVQRTMQQEERRASDPRPTPSPQKRHDGDDAPPTEFILRTVAPMTKQPVPPPPCAASGMLLRVPPCTGSGTVSSSGKSTSSAITAPSPHAPFPVPAEDLPDVLPVPIP